MKLRFLIAVLSSVCLIIPFIYQIVLDDSEGLSQQPRQIQKSIDTILSIQSARRGENLDLLSSTISHYDSQFIPQKSLFYIEFIKGYIASANNQYQEASEHFTSAKQHIHTQLPVNVLSRFYYEISYVELEQGLPSLADASYFKAESLFNDNNKYSDDFISISLGRTYDLVHTEKGNQLSIKQAQKTLEFAKQIQYSKMANVYFILGLSYWNNNQTIIGINYKLKALSIYINKKQYGDIVFSLTDIGIDYLFLKNYNEAIRQLTQALDYHMKYNKSEPSEAYYITYKLYSAYLKIGDMANTKLYLDKAKNTLNTIKDSIVKENFITNQLLLEADYLAVTGNPKDALSLLEQVNARHNNGLSNSFYHFDITLYNSYGKIYNLLGISDKSIEHHTLAKKAIQQRELFYLEDDTYLYLYEVYLQKKMHKQAAYYLKKSHAVKTKQLNDNNQAQTQFLLYSFNNEKKEDRILELENRSNKIITLSGFLLFILIVIATFARILIGKNSEISTLNEQLNHLSLTDSLTSIPNRRALALYLSELEATLTARSIMMIDVDYFKNYNDTYGHRKGDEALISIASALKECCQQSDFLARFGGEEFILIMNNKNKAESIKQATHIQTRIASLQIPHTDSTVSNIITLSLGITTNIASDIHNTDSQEAILNADKALYFSKNHGRNRFTHYSDIEEKVIQPNDLIETN